MPAPGLGYFLLPLELRLKRLFALGQCGLVASRVDPHIFAGAGVGALQLRRHVKVGAVRTEENIARQRLESCKHAPIVRRISGYEAGWPGRSTKRQPGFTYQLPTMTTSSGRPASFTCIVQVVQPRV